jgi:hypothetical protein
MSSQKTVRFNLVEKQPEHTEAVSFNLVGKQPERITHLDICKRVVRKQKEQRKQKELFRKQCERNQDWLFALLCNSTQQLECNECLEDKTTLFLPRYEQEFGISELFVD